MERAFKWFVSLSKMFVFAAFSWRGRVLSMMFQRTTEVSKGHGPSPEGFILICGRVLFLKALEPAICRSGVCEMQQSGRIV